MVRTIADNPSGWSRSLPGHTVEYDENYGLPWSVHAAYECPAGEDDTNNLVIPDDGYIYFIDMLGVSPGAYTVFRVLVRLNTVNYIYGTFTGWANIPLRQNPSLQFVYGDTITTRMSNDDASLHWFDLMIHGTKIPKPAGYAHGAF